MKITKIIMLVCMITCLCINFAFAKEMQLNIPEASVAENIAFEEILSIHIVKTGDAIQLKNPNGTSVRLVLFTGKAEGKYFNGTVLPGGVDTQTIEPNGGKFTISARYILEGTDYQGNPCRIFIENNGVKLKEPLRNISFRTHPQVFTDSKALTSFNNDFLIGEGLRTNEGTVIKIYRAL